MCLAVPARIEEIDGLNAVIDLDGVRRQISLLLCPDAELGQYALVHAGFAISVIDEEEARVAMEPWNEYKEHLADMAGRAAREPEHGADRKPMSGPGDSDGSGTFEAGRADQHGPADDKSGDPA